MKVFATVSSTLWHVGIGDVYQQGHGCLSLTVCVGTDWQSMWFHPTEDLKHKSPNLHAKFNSAIRPEQWKQVGWFPCSIIFWKWFFHLNKMHYGSINAVVCSAWKNKKMACTICSIHTQTMVCVYQSALKSGGRRCVVSRRYGVSAFSQGLAYKDSQVVITLCVHQGDVRRLIHQWVLY